ncbi:MAG: HAD hydrolase family protein [Limnoraphis sp.]
MIIKCSNCGQKNRLPEQIETNGIYKCASCQTHLLHREIEFHDKLIKQVMNELSEIRKELDGIKLSVFRQREIYFLRQKYEHNQSRIQTWLDHVEYIRDQDEKRKIGSSYKWEIQQIKNEIEKISAILSKKEEIKKIMQKFAALKTAFGILSTGLKLAGTVLSFLGIELGNNMNFLLKEMDIFLIEGGLES